MVIKEQNVKLKPGYKQTEVGVIPEDWKIGTLESVCVQDGLVRGPFGGALKREFFVKDGFKVYEQKNAIYRDIDLGSYFIGENKYKELKRFEVKEGDFIISCSGTIGKIFQVPKNAKVGIINQALLKIKTDNSVIHDKFFFYVFGWDKFQQKIIDNTQGGAMQNLVGMDVFRNVLIPLPPLSEQQAIATTLSDVDALITSLDKLITKKRDIKQATMQQLLMGKTRLPGFSGELKLGYKRTEIGEIPEDWVVKSIGDVVTDFRGGAPLTPNDFTRDGVKVLPKGGVVRGGRLRIGETEQQYCSQKYAEVHKNNQVNSLYTIVVLRDLVPSGPSIGLMVKIEDTDSFVLAQGVYGFKVNQDETNTDYLIQFSNGFDYRKLMNSIMVGSTQVHITNTALKKVLHPFPTLPEQQAIATVLSDMDAGIIALEQKRDKIRALKQGMMQELLTGKTRLL